MVKIEGILIVPSPEFNPNEQRKRLLPDHIVDVRETLTYVMCVIDTVYMLALKYIRF